MIPDDVSWIAVDWGTTRLRCWAIAADREVLAHASSGAGMASLSSGDGDFESALLDLIHPWLRDGETIPVHACGMAGARQGWVEVPYDPVPCPPATSLTNAPARDDRIAVSIHAGVRQDAPADVMRGEEIQIAGLLATQPEFAGLVCLPGTHSKWVEVRRGMIRSFRTFLTGELFGLLAEQSVLRHTVATDGWDVSAFLDSLQSTLKHPEEMLARCFSLRADALLNNLDEVAARSRLSGILIGQELAGALQVFPGTREVALIGKSAMTTIYATALRPLGIAVKDYHAEELVLAGLAAGFHRPR